MASLVADYGTSSNEENSDSEESSLSELETNVKDEPEKRKQPTEKLPTPTFGNHTSNSIFSNPFKEEENAKQAILEKHVKMVNTSQHSTTLNGKKICWNYRKGRCRFGTKCSFAHDSDLQKTEEELEEAGRIEQTVVAENCASADKSTIKAHEDKVKKKRPGLTQGLVPGKKVMKHYRQQNASSTITNLK